ncbi:methyltransferase domain-containing protein [Imbroritus primus]|uniref:class I SAM-dependent methyltransferase n=1 Tax=Imbroritus primus TaxID=3058603 RepID=UPI00026973C5
MTSESIAAARTWNERFSGEDYVFGREPNEYLRAQAELFAPGSRVLCVADGEGRNSVWLARQGLQVEAFDVAQAGVAKARRLADEAEVSVAYHVAGCDEWPWAVDAYDVVVAVFVQFADPEMRERSALVGLVARKP